ncbi:glycoside hydrolase family 9 protein [Vibrio nomapromontoriensis]|uniref:glycoside hydrolase family 9 protein n=1 Tax=Vibrio nomapromontoriensis TaxID=2910246 RepID=UPI003D0D56AC
MTKYLILLFFWFSAALYGNTVVLNQLGYEPEANKHVYLLGSNVDSITLLSMPEDFEVATFKLQYNSKLSDGKTVHVADFSAVSEAGWYYFRTGEQRSVPFEIRSNVYRSLSDSLIHALYLQRSGSPVHSPVTGMARPPSHNRDAVIFRGDAINPTGTYINAVGGWYDAGDFGKYISTATITIARLLEAYRQAPDYFKADHPQALPTILAEAQYGLQWMEKMQRSDGAVYRKLSGASWPAKIPPWLDTQQRYIFGVSTPDTAKYAATMAFAARIYQPYDKKLAARWLKSAQSAWNYLATQPSQYIDWQKADDSGSGPYIYNEHDQEASLQTDVDDRLWAAAELYLTTNDESFRAYFEQHYQDTIRQNASLFDFFEWKNPAIMGIWHMMQALDTPLSQQMKDDLNALAQRYATLATQSPFYVANQKFIWGSNKMVAEIGIVLAWSDMISNTDKHRKLVQSQIDYLLGANAFNMSFVTHFGTHSVRNLHHLYRIGTGVSLPGFLVGGPNIKAQANIAPKDMGMLSYVDSEKSYAVNEFAIDYNAALIGLLAIQSTYSTISD